MAEQPVHVRDYWRANERLIRGLLVVWAAVSLGGAILFVEPLNRFSIGSVPFGFWLAQQGAIYTFIALIFYYAWRMDRLDRQYHVGQVGEAA
jgi:putative solute:sodium symporter small subunit